MKTTSILFALPLLVTSALAGCGPSVTGPEIPDQAAYCSISFEEDFPETREVDLGVLSESGFQPYQEGDEIALISGGQGATMITPVVRVAKGAGDDAAPCFRVLVEESAGEFTSEFNVEFREEGDHLFSDGALYFITYSEGDVGLSLTVEGKGFSGTKSVNVTLR